jgi:hypothetical protein
MSIEALMKVAPPPEMTFGNFDGPWEPLEAALGATLPQDYKDLVRVYGVGEFLEYFRVHLPGCDNEAFHFENTIASLGRVMADDDDFPYVLWPEMNGLIIAGSTMDGDLLFWRRSGPAQDLSIIYWDSIGCQEFDCSLTEFLTNLITGELLPERFSPDYFENARPFTAFAPCPATVTNQA